MDASCWQAFRRDQYEWGYRFGLRVGRWLTRAGTRKCASRLPHVQYDSSATCIDPMRILPSERPTTDASYVRLIGPDARPLARRFASRDEASALRALLNAPGAYWLREYNRYGKVTWDEREGAE